MGVKSLEELESDLAAAQIDLETVNATITGLGTKPDKRDLEELETRFAEKEAEVAAITANIDRKERMDKALTKTPKPSGVEVGSEARTYERGAREADGTFRSFFRDVWKSKQDDPAAQARIARHAREVDIEQRASNITTASGGVGLVPPQYLLDELAIFARASRPFADALGPRPLPDVGMTFNVPRVTTGATTGTQSENAAMTDTAAVTDYLAFTVNTVAGQQNVSRQLLERSDPTTDLVIGQDLAADYAKQLDTQLLTQATNGITLLSGTNAVTAGTATAVAIWPKFADAIQQIWSNRFAAGDLIVMHPRRWAMFLGAVDSTNRPLVVPDAHAGVQAFNTMAQSPDALTPQGLVGQIQGLPVVVDPNIPTNLGGGTNQDVIIVTRRADQLFLEVSSPTVAVDTAVLSNTLQAKIYVYGYFAFTFARYAKATSIISGAGLVPPTF